jgi:hypothetical protein
VGQCGAAEHVHQVLSVRTEGLLGGEELVQRLHKLAVGGALLQAGVVEQLQVGAKGGVQVGEPQEQQLLQHDLAVGGSLGVPRQVLLRLPASAVEGHGRELVGELGQRPIHRFAPQAPLEPGEGFGEHLVVLLLPEQLGHVVEDLVDQPHGVDLPGPHDALRKVEQVPAVVHLLGEQPGGMKVGEDDVSAEGEQTVVKGVLVARPAADVELPGSPRGFRADATPPGARFRGSRAGADGYDCHGIHSSSSDRRASGVSMK